MTRIPEATRDSVPEHDRDAYDYVLSKGTPIGPGAISAHAPEMAKRRLPLSGYLRYELDIDPRITELAILTAARAMDCPYVWNAHYQIANQAGVSQAFLDALRDDKPLPDAPDDEIAIVHYGLELMRAHRVGDETFMKAHAIFGTQHLVELTSLMGHYAQNAFLVNAFEVDLPVPTSGPVLPV